MADPYTGGQGGDAGTQGTSAGAGAGAIQGGQPSQGQGQYSGAGSAGGGGGMPWESDERFRGKGPEDVWKSYTELNKKLGTVPEMEKKLQSWEKFGQAWQPTLEKVGWDPQRLAQMLEQRAQQARQQGHPQQANQLQQQANQAWADAMTPQDQEQWINGRMGTMQQQVRGEVQQVATALVDYFNRFGDLALRAIEQKFAQLPENIRPKLAINDLLQEAVNIATNRYDPLEWAAKIRTAEDPAALETRIRADERAKAEADYKNRSITTFSGSSTGAPRNLRPRAPQMTQGNQMVPRASEAEQVGQARERFANKWNEIAQT